MKRYLLILFLFISNVCVFSSVFDEKVELNTVKTEHFTVIFPSACTEAADRILTVAEDYYDEISTRLNIQPNFNFPVVITDSENSLNGYYINAPYNRIVLYDAVPPRKLMVFDNNLERVFYHELTHALSLSITTPFWKTMTNVFGDILNPLSMFNITRSFAEGITVSYESLQEGEGRVNSFESMAIISQAKAENKFPSWQNAAGLRELYPASYLHYNFGGAFSNYLQKKYGMDKYSELFKNFAKLSLFPTTEAFENTYGNSLKEEWTNFKDSVEVPNFVNIGNELYKDQSISDLKVQNNDKYWYSYSLKTIIKNGEIFFRGNSQDSKIDIINNHLLFSQVTSDFVKTQVIDTETKKVIADIDGIRSASFIDDKTIIGVKSVGQSCELQVINLENNEVIKSKILETSWFASNFIPYKEGVIFILFKGSTRYITYWNFNKDSFEGYEIKGLTSLSKLDEDKFIFSYDGKLGTITTDKVSFSSLLVSGGIDYISYSENEIFYVSHEYEWDKIISANLNDFVFDEVDYEMTNIQVETAKKEFNYDIEKYKPFSFFNRGMLYYVSDDEDNFGGGYQFMDPAEQYTMVVGGIINNELAKGVVSFFDNSINPFTFKIIFQGGYNWINKAPVISGTFGVDYVKVFDNNSLNFYSNYKIETNNNILSHSIVGNFYYVKNWSRYLGYWGNDVFQLYSLNNFSWNKNQGFETTNRIGLYFRLARILPIEPDLKNNFSLPLRLNSEYSINENSLSFEASPILYSREIQDGTNFLRLYLKRINLKSVNYYEIDFDDMAKQFFNGIQLSFQFSPIIGLSFSNIPFSLDLTYWFNGKEQRFVIKLNTNLF